ncbi:MAG: undecaprenyl-diphosphatase UppP [Thermoleophilia bacterium]|nr:undecaprenyl-diphosphatase UppP [Thermoleophilia bacterium]
MSELEALLLGIVQGLTEFLPISSSGHLILVPWLQDYTFLQENPEFNKTFDVALHIGTLAAVLSYFRADLVKITRAFFKTLRTRSIGHGDERLAWVIIIGTIPAVVVGALGSSYIDEHLGEPWMIALELIFFGLILADADRRPQEEDIEHVSLRHGLYIGLAQVLAFAPGASRSGVTITMGRYLRLTRDAAARVSFLIGIPAIAGAGVVKGYDSIQNGLPDGVVGPMIVGTIAAGVSGYLAIAGLLSYVRSNSYNAFVVFRVMVGLAVLVLIATGLRPATF